MMHNTNGLSQQPDKAPLTGTKNDLTEFLNGKIKNFFVETTKMASGASNISPQQRAQFFGGEHPALTSSPRAKHATRLTVATMADTVPEEDSNSGTVYGFFDWLDWRLLLLGGFALGVLVCYLLGADSLAEEMTEGAAEL
jgi:hypothetical protein